MTEHDWLSCTDPTEMLRFLLGRQASERKLRLLACACCRRIWHLLPDPLSRQAVEVAERFADGRASDKELARARNAALSVTGQGARQVAWAAYWAANIKASGPIENAFHAAAAAPARQAAQRARVDHGAAWDAEQAAGWRDQVALIREVFDNPFRSRRIDPIWLAWSGGVVRHLADGIYEDRAFDRMPVLGDALEEAGCNDREILEHCRCDGEHVRGCWVVDALLGKG
jgi:hypothetical protein